jgi:hypothetical protein
MGPADVTSRDAVLQAMQEYDQMGREAFLDKYGFSRSRKFVVFHEGRRYDSKALLAAAHGFQYPDQGPLLNNFSGGNQTTSRLHVLGFDIVAPELTSPTVSFNRGDCDLFSRYPNSVRWNPSNVPEEDQQHFRDIRRRLTELVGWLADQTRIDIPLKPFTSVSCSRMEIHRRSSGVASFPLMRPISPMRCRLHSLSLIEVRRCASALAQAGPSLAAS